MVGYISDTGNGDLPQLLKRLVKNEPASLFSKMGGVFAATVINGHTDHFHAFNTVFRSVPVVYAETHDYVFVGTRQLLVHLASKAFEAPDYNLPAMVSYVFNNYYVENGTPFKNTFVLPMNSHLQVVDGRLSVTTIDDLALNPTRDECQPGDDRYYDELANVLYQSVLPFCGTNSFHKLLLSGGKDSRVVAAALHKAGLHFVCETAGYLQNPDVIYAREVAKRLGRPTRVYLSEDDHKSTYIENIYEQMCKALFHFDGTNIDVPTRATPSKCIEDGIPDGTVMSGIAFAGTGGECIRGGDAIYSRSFAQGNLNLSHQEVRNILNEFGKPRRADLLAADLYRRYAEWWEDFVAKHYQSDQPAAILNYNYLCHSEGMKNAFCASSGDVVPVLDNRLMKMALRIPLADKLRDIPHFQLLRRLAPELGDVPVADDRWGFEARGPLPG